MITSILLALPMAILLGGWLFWYTQERVLDEQPGESTRFGGAGIYNQLKLVTIRVPSLNQNFPAMVPRERSIQYRMNTFHVRVTMKQRPFCKPFITRVRWPNGSVDNVYTSRTIGVKMAMIYTLLAFAYALAAPQLVSTHLAWLFSGSSAILCGLSLNLFRYRPQRPFNSPLSIFGAFPFGTELPAWCISIAILSLVTAFLFTKGTGFGMLAAGFITAFELGSLIGYLLCWAWSPR